MLKYARILARGKGYRAEIVQKEVKELMRKYQLLYIISSAVNEEERETLINKVESIITKNGGVIEGTEKSGMKKLAYPINYRTEGFYVLVNFTAEDSAPNVIAKTLNITDNIIRQMIVAK